MFVEWFMNDNVDLNALKDSIMDKNKCAQILYRHMGNIPLIAKMINLVIEIAGEEKMIGLLEYTPRLKFIGFALGFIEYLSDKDKQIIIDCFDSFCQYLSVEDRMKLFDTGIIGQDECANTIQTFFPHCIEKTLREKIMSIPQQIIDHAKIYNMIVDGKNDELAEYVEKFTYADKNNLMMIMGNKIRLNIDSSAKNIVVPRIIHPEAFFESFDKIANHLENDGTIEIRPCNVDNDSIVLENVNDLIQNFSRYINGIDWNDPGVVEKFLAPFKSGKYKNNRRLMSYCVAILECFIYDYERFVEVYRLAIKACDEKKLNVLLINTECEFYLHVIGVHKISCNKKLSGKLNIYRKYIYDMNVKKIEGQLRGNQNTVQGEIFGVRREVHDKNGFYPLS